MAVTVVYWGLRVQRSRAVMETSDMRTGGVNKGEMRIGLLAAALVTASVLSGPTSARVVYVDGTAPAGGDGSSWQKAYKYLQDGLAVAKAGDEVRVAQGTYKPDRSAAHPEGTRDRRASFVPASGVSLLGGYAGRGQADPNANDVVAFRTILSGDLAGDDVPVADPCDLESELSRKENSCNIAETEYSSAIGLGGLTLSGGFANLTGREDASSTARGAGLRANGCNGLSVQRCTFIGNYAVYGGGADLQHCTGLWIDQCTFCGNSASWGGGLDVYSCTGSLLRSVFRQNYADNGGGMNVNCDSISIESCQIIGNAGGSGGGAMLDGGQTIVDCLISGNSALRGGGVYYGVNGTKEMVNCRVTANLAQAEGGGLLISTGGDVRLRNTLLCGNQASGGGALWAGWYTNLDLLNCTLAQNKAGRGRAILYKSTKGHATIVNSIVADDAPAIVPSSTPLLVAYCNINGGQSNVVDTNGVVVWGQGNTNVDPCLVDQGYWPMQSGNVDSDGGPFVEGDYHLKSQAGRRDAEAQTWVKDSVTSPCIDAGDPNTPIGLEPFPNGGRVNMGAYGGTAEASKSYFGKPVCETIVAGDIDGDCVVGFKDLAILASRWLGSGGNPESR